MSTIRWGALLLIALLMAGCAPGGVVQVDARADGTGVMLRPGQVLEIILPANPTTGYQWQMDPTSPIDEGVLTYLGDTYQPGGGPGVVGAGGRWTGRFQAVNTGETEIRLVYVRPWEQEAKPAETFSLHVVVR
ncbi:MAG TPA: protease inhibitor I42 family protein [Caldilineae bacterium]|jgi:inhibitor of cysteine peptidase|nr:protease inhibitor I42 family protein [Caldilineae bacterium]